MRDKLKNKLKKQGGFTLVEMLIVVAIIAILIAISIPIMNGSLEKARQATDAANERAAKAAASIEYLTNGTVTANNAFLCYDAAAGTIVGSDQVDSLKYGKCTTNNHKGGCLKIQISDTGAVKVFWSTSSNKLCSDSLTS